MSYVVTINAPRWTRWRALAWLARVTGISRRWEARGLTLTHLIEDLHRLGALHGATVRLRSLGDLEITFADCQTHAVQVYEDA